MPAWLPRQRYLTWPRFFEFGQPRTPPAPAGGGKGGGKGGEIPDYMKEAAGRIGQPRTPPPSDMQAPPAGGGLFGGKQTRQTLSTNKDGAMTL